jgi:hypothetical protein
MTMAQTMKTRIFSPPFEFPRLKIVAFETERVTFPTQPDQKFGRAGEDRKNYHTRYKKKKDL